MLSALSLPSMSLVSSNAIATESGSTKIIAVTEDICQDTRAFAANLPVSLIDTDPASMMLHIASGFENQDFEIAYGLTRDSNMMLIEQYAQQFDYSLQYHGIHSYAEGRLLHEITASNELLGKLEKQLTEKPSDWVTTISRVPVLTTRHSQKLLNEAISTTHAIPSDGTGQLVSWMFTRA